MPGDFFETIYANAAGDESAVPWQQAMSRPLFSQWMAGVDLSRFGSALVVAAGLGDDAAAIAARGAATTAFDYSPSAVDWARSRHRDADVEWHVADLLDPPAEWTGAFDLVVEVFTVQSIEPERQADAAAAIRDFVAPGGSLMAIAIVRSFAGDVSGPPWPIHIDTFGQLTAGLDVTNRVVNDLDDGVTCELVEATLPPDTRG